MSDNTAATHADESPGSRWQRVKTVFLRALECPDSERAAFLNEACGTDQALQAEVESLLNCHVQAVEGGFLDDLPESSSPRAVLEAMAAAFDAAPTAPTLRDDRDDDERPTHPASNIMDVPSDDRFGDYRLLEQIGQGGMGVVYRAQQLSLNRVVALKMIRAGRFSTQGEIERFTREAEAAAGLTHPGIVPVFEIGEEEGRHYFTMALVDGTSLADHLKDAGGPLEPKAAADLMRQVAGAVQYAHEHGVIHRDLKPANVLLDKQGKPRVVDFGLAKHVETESGLTFTGQVLGTPSFMSPEQAGGGTSRVDPSADVYSLGAVLYALLTGRPPFSAASVAETLRQVQQDDPVRPRQLNSALPRDLETICLKCLAKEPSKRYPLAQDLADELGRYLSGRPILARPIGAFAASARWCRRNPLAASFGAFVAVFVPTIIAVLLLLNIRLSQETAKAHFEQQMATHSFHSAKNAVDEQFTLVSEEELLDRPGLQPLRRQLLLGSKKYYEEFLATRGADPNVQAEAALIHFRLGVITAMLTNNSDQDSLGEANAYFEKARQLYEALPNQNSSQVLWGLGHVWTRIGHVCNKLHQHQREIEAFQRALELRTRLVAIDSSLENHRLLANTHMNLGQALLPDDPPTQPALYKEAANHLEIARTIRNRLLDQEPHNATVARDQAKGYIAMVDALASDQPLAVEVHLKAALSTLDAQSQTSPPTLEDTFLRAVIARRLGAFLADSAADEDDLRGAQEYFELALSLLGPLAEDNPQVVDYLSALGATYYDLALISQELASVDEAQTQLRTALQLLGPLTKGRNPDDILRWAGAHTILAELAPPNSNVAIQHLQEARTLLLAKINALKNDDNAQDVRQEYQAAVLEIDELLANQAGS